MNHGTLLLAAVALAAALTASCSGQPSIGCPVQRYTWAARFNLVPGQTVTGDCTSKGGERLGIQKYNDPSSGENQLVIKPFTLAALDADDPAHPAYSLGAFASEADENDFCAATNLNVARKEVPDLGVDIAYEWTSVQLLARPDAPGSQLLGTVNYTEGGCTAAYEVWAMWPSVSCANPDTGEPDDAICSEEGHALNLAFDSICDPTQNRCVPGRRPPSFR